MTAQVLYKSSSLCCSIVSLFLLTVLPGCSDIPIAGSISETTNGAVTGIITNSDGTPATQTQVQLYPEDYYPVKDTRPVPADTTDVQGKYNFVHLKRGDYCLQAKQIINGKRTCINNIHVNGDTNVLSTGILQNTGTITVSLSDNNNAVNGYIYIPGSSIVVPVAGATGYVTIDSVPASSVNVVYQSPIDTTAPTVLRYDVPVSAGDTVTITNTNWKYSMRLFMNTGSTGAAVNVNVISFPVLIRLSSNNFIFSQARTDGADIRFVKQNGIPLAYEIEQWDTKNEKAEIWVTMDTIYGNDSSHSIQMLWGKSDAISQSGATVVFDTANKFAGVWHMNEIPGGNTLVSDHTQNGFNGSTTGLNNASSIEGIIGRGLSFNGTTDFITLPAISTDFTKGFTVCGWMKYRAFNNYSRLIDFGVNGDNNNNIVFANKYLTNKLRWTIWNGTIYEIALDVPDYFSLDTWIYVTGTYDGTYMHVYKNGDLVGAMSNPDGLKTVLRTASYIGKSNWAADALYNGLIDELQVSCIARSNNWIKLSYMNQKEQDALVQFK